MTMDAETIIKTIYDSLLEKGYDPAAQFAGYIMSGDPSYITTHNNARSLITKVEREELLEALLENYIDEAEHKKEPF